MARTNRKSGQLISLFPFLSILACVMGTLTLIIYGVALGQPPASVSTETLQAVLDRIAKVTDEIDELEAQIAQALERESRIAELKDEVARQLSTLPGSLGQLELAAGLLPQYEDLTRQIQAMEEQLTRSTLELNNLRQQIEAVEEELDKAAPATPSGLTAGLTEDFIGQTGDVPMWLRLTGIFRKGAASC